MKCYKCRGTEELSRRNKTQFMCRPCRRGEYAAKKQVWKPQLTAAEVRLLARCVEAVKSNGRVMAKWVSR